MRKNKKNLFTLLLALIVFGITFMGYRYVTGHNIFFIGTHDNSIDTSVFRKNATVFSTGDMAALQWLEHPFSVADVTFKDENNVLHSLAEFKGRVLLVNLWATWCAPCRAEMPDLDILQKEKGGKDFAVVTISVDTQGIDIVKDFYEEISLTSLPYYIDESLKVMSVFKSRGLPASFFVDTKGYVVGRLLGPALWAGKDAFDVVDFLVKDNKGL